MTQPRPPFARVYSALSWALLDPDFDDDFRDTYIDSPKLDLDLVPVSLPVTISSVNPGI